MLHASSFDARCMPMLHEVTDAGIDWLSSLGRLPARAVTFSRRDRPRSLAQLPHTLLVIETLLKIERDTATCRGLRFVAFDEILSRAPTTTRAAANPLALAFALPSVTGRPTQKICVIPDALYGIEHEIDGEKRYRFWALECERTIPAWRSNSDSTSLAWKISAYEELIAAGRHRQHWGIPNLKLNIVKWPAAGFSDTRLS